MKYNIRLTAKTSFITITEKLQDRSFARFVVQHSVPKHVSGSPGAIVTYTEGYNFKHKYDRDYLKLIFTVF